jgi:antitoxin component YwqK of YwqJK toxin-antitoxin module
MGLKRVADEAKNGVVETYYDNGQQWSRTNYKNDKLNGLRETWYENGQQRSRSNFKDGVKQ